MPQQINLNVAPYFDDFDSQDDYHKVLFKPGYPVQARELNNLQSILQNQIERFGQHFFKEGAKVIPGGTGYNREYTGIQLNNNFKGVPVSAYVDQLLGTKISGLTSGVTAVVGDILLPEDSERNTLTLYCNYISSNTTNNTTQTFSDGEELSCSIDITSGLLGNSVITAGAAFAETISSDAPITGSSYQIQSGVYFVRGQFVEVESETLILSQYSTNPTYRVGLYVDEQIINADQDETLNDNSQGFNNYSAPGADRLKVTLSLFKKSINDFDDNNFIELAQIDDGKLEAIIRKGLGGGVFDFDMTDTLARRTFEESGDYYVKPFEIVMENSLNNNIGNRGIFQANQFTYGGAVPSDDLALYKISPGKAYVKGYEIETLSTTWIDVDKTRTTKTLEDQSILYNTGLNISLNRNYRSPAIGIGNTYYVSLRDERVGTNSWTAPGNEIGVARVYDYRLESGSYNTTNGDLNVWGISLYDIQSYTNITLNYAHTLSIPCYVEGENSGASGFLRSAVSNSTSLTLYEVSGEFIENENLSFNGIVNGRIIKSVTKTSISDTKSIYGTNNGITGINTFSADIVQLSRWNVGVVTITAASGSPSISTVRSINLYDPSIELNVSFSGRQNIKVGDLVQYSDTTIASDDPVRGRVTSVGLGTDVASSHITIEGVTAVTGICGGTLPTSQYTATDFKILTSNLNPSLEELFTTLPRPNVSDVDLTKASLTIRKSFTVNIASNEITGATKPTAGPDEVFLPFDDERYSLVRSDGTTEVLNASKFSFNATSTEIGVRGLGTNDTGATFVATLKKSKPKAKKKIKNRVNSIVVDKSKNSQSGIGSTTVNDGLIYGNYPYGTRVQDKIISLNVPDVIAIHGIYESAGTSSPSAPEITLTSIKSSSGTTAELIIGELLIGQTSGTVAICAEKLNNTQLTYILKNDFQFVEGETVEFQESQVSAIISTLNASSYKISTNFIFNTGQETSFYDYGVIKRKEDAEEPVKQLKIYFENAYYDSTDEGDITTVNSYESFDYSTQIRSVDGISNSDIIDIRPRTNTLSSISEGDRSPLEFFGREFNQSGNSASTILASNENIITDVTYYQGRIDRIFLTKNGKFQLVYGTPSDNPNSPNPVDNAIEIATINIPPYLYNPTQASIKFLDHKRFKMSDIKTLEDRIRNLEYYTTLSLLEANTANLFVPDNDGINRYKAGFFVDNFTTFASQFSSFSPKNSIDRQNHACRPSHYTDSVDLVFGPVDSRRIRGQDMRFSSVEGTNVRKQNDVITLDYVDEIYLSQRYGTRTESVTPFLISFWQGTIELTPSSDTWVDTARIAAKIIDVEGDYAATLDNAVRNMDVDPQTGFAPVVWNAWEVNWTGQKRIQGDIVNRQQNIVGGWGWSTNLGGWPTVNVFKMNEANRRRWRNFHGSHGHHLLINQYQDIYEEVIDTGTETRTGSQVVITEQFDRESLGDRVVSRELIQYMRSRNIEFVSKRMKPLTRMYAFFDGVNVTKYCVPKLLEIEMSSGTFEVGENVRGRMEMTGFNPEHPARCASIRFRVAQANHREGPYNSPTSVYPENPYTTSILSANYSSTSTILNVDTYSLSDEAEGEYFGWVDKGLVLTGETSGAQAKITNVRLVSDLAATLLGSYFNPDPNCVNHPRFEAGTKTFTLLNNDEMDLDSAVSVAEESFTSTGTLETIQENIVSVRNAHTEIRNLSESRHAEKTTGMVLAETIHLSQTYHYTAPPPPRPPRDPLAQSFKVQAPFGLFVTQCDVFFRSKDDMDLPVTFQIRTMTDGYPTEKVLPFSEVVLPPEDVILSADGSAATTFQFSAPVYLEPFLEYALVLVADSTKYSVYVARVGENDLITQTYISNQPHLGSLFKSQNGSTWEPSQWEDLKFTLYRAKFEESGSVDFYSPALTEGNGQVPTLLPDSLIPISRKVRVGLGTTGYTTPSPGPEVGNTFIQSSSNATGNLVGTAGTAQGTLTITNAGIGYTPVDGSYTFTGVNLVTLTGNGQGATGDVTVTNGVAVAATVGGGGYGYQVGDVVGVTTIGIASIGKDLRLTVAGIGQTSELILDNVQGEFLTGAGNTFSYYNSSGVRSALNTFSPVGGAVTATSINIVSDGLHVKVNHKNHGMWASDNMVEIMDASSDVKPTKLSTEYLVGSLGSISVDDASNFTTFEGVGVGTTNVGVVRIDDELISYTEVSGNTLGGIVTRQIPFCGNQNARCATKSLKAPYPVGTLVHKYELDGVSLLRINKIHNLSDATISEPITFDSYHIKLDMSEKFNVNNDDRSNDVGFPALYLKETKSTGGYRTKATQNIPFEIITPIVQNLTVEGTTLNAEVRSITNSSFSGNEIPWVDAGFESINVSTSNYLETPRMIASQINEVIHGHKSQFPGNKSFNMRLNLNTIDDSVSPVIDSQRISTILTSNRVNSVITDYANDKRVNSIETDPSACQYISKQIALQNPASSIKIIVDAYINSASDIRAFYAIADEPGFKPIFTPFPGFSNLNSRGQIVSRQKSDGKSDSAVLQSNSLGFTAAELDFKEYTFTADNLPSFGCYQIKIILTSTSQVFVPQVKNLRVIALA